MSAQELRTMGQRLIAMADAMDGGSTRAPSSSVASDADLDGAYGDPEIRKDPPRWNGASYAGQKMSRCPSDYLETLASFFDWKAGKDDEKAANGDEKAAKYARYARTDASRARGWAKRNAGKKIAPPEQPELPEAPSDFGGGASSDDDLPFDRIREPA